MSEEQPLAPKSNDPNAQPSEQPDQPIETPPSSPDPISAPEAPPRPNTEWDTLEAELAPSPSSPPQPTPDTAVPPVSRPGAQSQTLQTLQQLWRTVEPPLRQGTIRVLRTTIHLLERTVTRLESGLEAEPPAAPAPRPPANGTGATDGGNIGTSLQGIGQRIWTGWKGILPSIRGILPAAVNETLSSDRALTGAIASVLILVLWGTSSLFSSQPPEQIAIAPPSKSVPALEKKTPQNVPDVKVIPPPPVVTPNPDAPTPTATPSPLPAPAPSPSPLPSPLPAPLPAPVPKPTPTPPPLKLTPEQTLIARIQDQVGEVSDQYVNGLIQSVQANFRSSRLTVKLGEGWYTLGTAQQDRLANDVLKRAQQLNFVKLELVDADGDLLARSPVIGSEMVVLRRSRFAPTPETELSGSV